MKNQWPYSYILYDAFYEQYWKKNGDKKAIGKAMKSLAEAGYQACEFPGLYSFKTVDDVKAVIRMAHDHGLEVSETKHTYDFVKSDPKERRTYIEATKNALKLAAGAGIDKVQVFTGPGFSQTPILWLGKDIKEGQAWEYVFEAYDEIVPLAEKLGVYLTLEPVYNMCVREFFTLKYFMDRYKSKNIAVNFDAAHYNLYREDIGWVVKQLGNKIKHVHLRDSAGKSGYPAHNGEDFSWLMFGEGTVDWTGEFRALKEIGYKGYISVEFSGNWTRDVLGWSFEELAKILKTSIDNLIAMA